MNKHHLTLGISVLTALAVGGAGGFLIAKKILEQQFDEQMRQEIETTKNFYSILYKKEGFETPEAAADKLLPPERVQELLDGGGEFAEDPHAKAAAAVLKSYGGHDLNGRTIVTETITENVFVRAELQAEGNTDEDWAKEKMNRTEEAPYVLSQAEYMENETDYEQITITYYSGDGVLADDQENRIDEIDELMGDYNLVRFGAWSNDSHVLYVRNDVKELEIEVILNEGKYAEIVQGLVAED